MRRFHSCRHLCKKVKCVINIIHCRSFLFAWLMTISVAVVVAISTCSCFHSQNYERCVRSCCFLFGLINVFWCVFFPCSFFFLEGVRYAHLQGQHGAGCKINWNTVSRLFHGSLVLPSNRISEFIPLSRLIPRRFWGTNKTKNFSAGIIEFLPPYYIGEK